MRVQLAQQAKAILGQSDLVMSTEQVDDVAVLIGQMVKMVLPEVLDRHIPRHCTQRGLSWGWTAVIWLAYIVTEGGHRKVSVETYLKGMHHTLSHLTAQVIEPLNLSDDRLSHLLKHLSKPAYWHAIERDLNERSTEIDDLSQDVIRCDATTVSSDHEVTKEGLVQFGHNKDDPARPQIKVMIGSLDPLGMPLATDVLSGERADDGSYLPIMEWVRTGLKTPGLLFVGDCKMSAWDTRAHLARRQDCYLPPLPLTGATVEAMDAWITEGVTQGERGALARIGVPMTVVTKCWWPKAMSLSGPVRRRALPWTQRHGMNGYCDGALPHACRPTGCWVGKTSVPCGDQTGNPDAPERAGQTANH
jgi:transposase